jgi:hypothetical protein
MERRNGEWKMIHRVIAPEAVGYVPADLRWMAPRMNYDGADAHDRSYTFVD